VSLESGAAVVDALQERGHRVQLIDPIGDRLAETCWSEFDAAFIALHGAFGEDGQVQRMLENQGIPCTGTAATESAIIFSKTALKHKFQQAGVSTPPFAVIRETDDATYIQSQAQRLGFPLVVKPDTQGSSLGVSLAETPDALPAALAKCFHFDSIGLLEVAVPGTEWTAGFLDQMALPLIQIETQHAFFDFQAKYQDDSTQYHFDFDLGSEVLDRIRHQAVCACRTAGTRGLARVDIRVDHSLHPWVLEINSVPGLTSHSLIPMAAARMGLDLPLLCEQSVHSCLQAAEATRIKIAG
jgi:D-alanine-D-alanine ligase